MKTNYKIAIVGSTGLVGRTVLKVLEEKNFKNCTYFLFASKKSAGSKIQFLGQNYIIQELTENTFKFKFDYAIFCAGGNVSKKFIPLAVESGCTIIDDRYKIKRIVYSTYQAVSGAGKAGIEDLENGIKGITPNKFPYPIFNNCIPHIDVFESDGYTKEEYKMINETRKILNKPLLPITATCVRVPVKNCHSESINVEFKTNFDIYDVKMLLQNSPGIVLVDDIDKNYYPLATKSDGYDDVFVGRIRRDFSVPFGLNLWVVSDNLRKGAASNAVQILEKLLLL